MKGIRPTKAKAKGVGIKLFFFCFFNLIYNLIRRSRNFKLFPNKERRGVESVKMAKTWQGYKHSIGAPGRRHWPVRCLQIRHRFSLTPLRHRICLWLPSPDELLYDQYRCQRGVGGGQHVPHRAQLLALAPIRQPGGER